jgi:hypothetical protein
MNEQVFLNGVPVAGLGDTDSETKFYATAIGVPLLGLVGGAAVGGIVGNKINPGAAGIALGAVGGSVVGVTGSIVALKLITQRAIDQRNQQQ